MNHETLALCFKFCTQVLSHNKIFKIMTNLELKNKPNLII